MRAKYGNTEEWRQDKYYNNAANSCIPIGDSIFKFIKKFSGGLFFSGRVDGIQSNDKRKCNFRVKCFVVDIFSRNITITWVGIKKRIVAKSED